jgi:hypothetical protein
LSQFVACLSIPFFKFNNEIAIKIILIVGKEKQEYMVLHLGWNKKTKISLNTGLGECSKARNGPSDFPSEHSPQTANRAQGS